MRDAFGRTVDYLRVSLTENCNFRCLYCVPPEGVAFAEEKDLLRADEIVRLAKIFVHLGIRRVRLTGGEPLLRTDILPLVHALSLFKGLEDVALTTNGSLLAPLARPLKEAGLTTVNVSLDSLDRERFRKITARDRFDDVFAGLQEALKASLRVKINVLALSDLSREEVLAFCRLALRHPVSIRFLEFMPLCGDGWAPEKMLPISTIRRWVSEVHALRPLPREHHVAETFAISGGRGTVGFIASLSEPFCDSCNRLRLTASGELSLCLFSTTRIDLKAFLRSGESDREIREQIRAGVHEKPQGRRSLEKIRNPRELPHIRVIGG
ncbi:MAG: GTP 3',8-cyclase MoaA [Pseudomonadota bacterium]